ncbi:uncharacterized protein LOC113549673 isoform X1 [Rhopalosiphum maidis]|uniref:uncharacterized protein LOC113549673 isoform X1 n=1 Tax=Rhopalosiphum maidis TaxID=43146 RepID=UPI000F0096E7|nr:uncharacterized protein LOC113549673 isoform X1 [Rhopalosiphum maidis]XP_060834570.1 uncharacterized protein LOC132917715 isoform X1 [Rhopalosiphum padi]XP_060834571.1 uncharacterized protein LOC132917715 isoform X1 [Rhopalosiphum padi]
MTEANILYCSVSVRYRVMNNSSKSFFRWIISEIFCCWKQQNELSENLAVSYTEITHSNTADVLELQPLTLRNYVNSLEPYNPEVHGWRDTTPPVMRSVKHSERATQLVTAIRMSGLQDIEILGVPDGHS